MATTQVNTYTSSTGYANLAANVDYNALGADITTVIWTGSAFEVVEGSFIEANGSRVVVDVANESLGNSTGSVCYNSATNAWSISSAAKSYVTALGGWYLDASSTTRVTKWDVTTGGGIKLATARAIPDPSVNSVNITTLNTGSGNYTVPQGVYRIEGYIIGGGGGSSGAQNGYQGTENIRVAGGGGGGATILFTKSVTPGETIAYSIGAAGTPGTGASGASGSGLGNGGDGGDTDFGPLRAEGGSGGLPGSNSNFAAGGSASTTGATTGYSYTAISGGSGNRGALFDATVLGTATWTIPGAAGGSSIMPLDSKFGFGISYGGGGTGPYATNLNSAYGSAGSSGNGGAVIIKEYP